MTPPRTLHLYLDEAEREIADGRVLLVGGLTLPTQLRWTQAQWYQYLLQHPHASESPRTRRGDLIGEAAWSSLASGALPGARVHVQGSLWSSADSTAEPRKWGIAVAALLARVVLREGLCSADKLWIYPDRMGTGSGSLQGRIEGIAATLRWMLPPGATPTVAVESWPKDPNHLVGVSLIDLLLYNICRRFRDRPDPWLVTARQAVREMRMGKTVEVVEAPPVYRPGSLQVLLLLEAGRLAQVDWTALLQAPIAEVRQILRRGLDTLDPSALDDAIAAALAGLAPYAEDVGLAQRSGVSMDTVLEVLQAIQELATEGSTPAPGPPTGQPWARRLSYLLARVHSHRGRPDRAAACWRTWDRGMDDQTMTPALFDELVQGLTAEIVFLTDLELWDQADDKAARALDLVGSLLGAFERVPVRGKLLGARAQARILGRRELHTVPALLRSSAQEFDSPKDWSYAWTWRLVGLGRGMPCDDPAAAIHEVLEAASKADWGPPTWSNRFLVWGLVEALTRPGMAEALPDLRHAIASEVNRERPATSDLDRLILRAWGTLTERDEPFQAALRGAPPTVQAVARGDLRPRIHLRSLAAWLAATDASPAARSAALNARVSLGVGLGELDERAEMSGVRAAVHGFLAFDIGDAEAARAWLGQGGW